MLKYIKPSGQIVEINEHPDNLATAKRLGWISEDEIKAKAAAEKKAEPEQKKVAKKKAKKKAAKK